MNIVQVYIVVIVLAAIHAHEAPKKLEKRGLLGNGYGGSYTTGPYLNREYRISSGYGAASNHALRHLPPYGLNYNAENGLQNGAVYGLTNKAAYDLGYKTGYGLNGIRLSNADYSRVDLTGRFAAREFPVESVHTIQTINRAVPVPVPQPYPVTVNHEIPVPVAQPVPVDVPRAVPFAVPHPVPVTVTKHVPVEVPKAVAVPVPQAVPVSVPQPYAVSVPQPYAVPVPQAVVVSAPQAVVAPVAQAATVSAGPVIPISSSQILGNVNHGFPLRLGFQLNSDYGYNGLEHGIIFGQDSIVPGSSLDNDCFLGNGYPLGNVYSLSRTNFAPGYSLVNGNFAHRTLGYSALDRALGLGHRAVISSKGW